MSLESKVHDSLMNTPVIKKAVKRVYQYASVAISRPKKSEGIIMRVTPDDDYEYLFGYYDKSPWDASGRYMLCLRVRNASKNVAPGDEAEIVLIDTGKNNETRVIAKTHTWNVQQGCMAGWLGPNFDKEIFYNDCRHGKYCGIILNIETGKEKILDMPVYTVSNDGKIALSLDFSRLHRLRPGYGYSNIKDRTIGQKIPDGPCVWKIDIKTGKSEPILSYEALYNFEHRKDMENADHKVNHLMLSPDGKRFMVIHRWLKGGKKISRLLTCDINGENLYNLSDEDMVSHCCWKNNREILAYCKHDDKNGYFLFKDQTKDCSRKWDFITADGHPSYSPNGKLVVTDTYPNRKRICTLRVLSDAISTVVAKVYAPFKYDNDTRCDLHPRWSRDGRKICFDGCFEGKREVYIIFLPEKKKDNKFSIITPIYNIGDSIKPLIDSLNAQYDKSFEVIFVDDSSDIELSNRTKKEIKNGKFDYKYIRNNENIGAGKSRNKGIQKASGNYLLFVDADDYVSPKLIANLHSVSDETRVDVILFDLQSRDNNKKKTIKSLYGCKNGAVKKNEVLLYSANCVAGKCIKKEIVDKNKIIFPNLVRYEDWAFNCRVFSNSETFYYNDKVLYYYVNNPSSTKNSNADIGLECAIRAFDEIDKLKIKSDIKCFLHIREIEYIYVKKMLLGKRANKDIEFVKRKDINKKYVRKGHIKFNKYLVIKLLMNSLTRKMVVRDEK